MYFENYNANPNNKKTGDCVVRALSKALDKSWDVVYMDLCEIGFELKVMPNDDECYMEYLKSKGFTKETIKVTKGSKRPTVTSFTKEHQEGTYILRVANHLVTVKDGKYFDIWDSGSCCLYGFWKIK